MWGGSDVRLHVIRSVEGMFHFEYKSETESEAGTPIRTVRF